MLHHACLSCAAPLTCPPCFSPVLLHLTTQGITKGPDGTITSLSGELNPAGDPKKTKLKLTWLADVPELVPLTLVDFGYLITKKKVEEEDDFKALINPNSRYGLGPGCALAVALANLRGRSGIQLVWGTGGYSGGGIQQGTVGMGYSGVGWGLEEDVTSTTYFSQGIAESRRTVAW
jgi:hypothetical protein